MKKLNVVSMGDFRDLRELRRSGDTYRGYLKSLGDSQLGAETRVLLSEASEESCKNDLSQRVGLVLDEIASRVDGQWSEAVMNLKKDNPLLQP